MYGSKFVKELLPIHRIRRRFKLCTRATQIEVSGSTNLKEKVKNIPVKRVVLIRAYVEDKFVAVWEFHSEKG